MEIPYLTGFNLKKKRPWYKNERGARGLLLFPGGNVVSSSLLSMSILRKD
jgi:hypothetical protein